ncbi:hypothetical protein H9P43_002091 [Blastocladiella emersonii ATCC 22665]|nr:hypothetical protein H9P43_002091 [Blastocladiella emersonii ATCC 22665]
MNGIRDFVDLLAASLNSTASSENVTFELVHHNTGYTSLGSTQAAQAAIFDDGAHALITELSSSNTMPAVLMGVRYNSWTCSGSATSTLLNDKTEYPTFFRTIAPDDVQGFILAKFIQHMGWARVCVLAASDAYGTSVSSVFLANTQRFGITVASSQVIDQTARDFSLVLDNILQSDTNIIIVFANPEYFLPLLRQAKARELISENYVWLGPEAWSLFTSLSELTAQDHANANGMMYVMPREEALSEWYNASIAQWSAAYPGRQLPSYSHFFMDCATALARGLARLSRKFGSGRVLARNYTASLTDFLAPFDGVSGDVEFDAIGNRKSYFSVYNLYGGTSQVVYEIGPDLVVPRDSTIKRALYLDWNLPGALALVALDCAAIVLIVVTVTYLHRHRAFPDIKNLSFPFLVLICVGCVLVLVSNLADIGQPSTASCIVSNTAFVLGFNLVIAAAAAKAYRLWRLLDTKKALVTSGSYANRKLFRGIGACLALQAIILIVWTTAYPFGPAIVSARTYYYYRCRSSNDTLQTLATGVTFTFNAALVAALVVLGYRTRNAISRFRESIFLLSVGQNISVSALVVAPFSYFDFGASTLDAAYIKHAMIVYAALFTFVALAGRLVVPVYRARRGMGVGGHAIRINSTASDHGEQQHQKQYQQQQFQHTLWSHSFSRAQRSMAGKHDADYGASSNVGAGTGTGVAPGPTASGTGGAANASAILLTQEDLRDGDFGTVLQGLFPVRELTGDGDESGSAAVAAKVHLVELDTVRGCVVLLPETDGGPLGVAIRLVDPIKLIERPSGHLDRIVIAYGQQQWEIQFASQPEAERWFLLLRILLFQQNRDPSAVHSIVSAHKQSRPGSVLAIAAPRVNASHPRGMYALSFMSITEEQDR